MARVFLITLLIFLSWSRLQGQEYHEGKTVRIDELPIHAEVLGQMRNNRTANQPWFPFSPAVPIVGRRALFVDLQPKRSDVAIRAIEQHYVYAVDLDSTAMFASQIAEIPYCQNGLVSSPVYSPATGKLAFVVRQLPSESKERHPLSDPEALASMFVLVDVVTGKTSLLEAVGNRIGKACFSFSPSGRYLAFYASVPGGGFEDMGFTVARKVAEQRLPWSHLRILDLETGVSRQISPGIPDSTFGRTPKWSPDGKRIAVSMAMLRASGKVETRVHLFDIETSHAAVLPAYERATWHGEVEWINNESLLVYASRKLLEYDFASREYKLIRGNFYAVALYRSPDGSNIGIVGKPEEGNQSGPLRQYVLSLQDPLQALREDPLDAAAPGSPWAYPAFK